MAIAILVNFINLFVFVYNILLLGRIILSWINPHPTGGLGGLLVELTEPVLLPIRRVLPKSQMFDFSPLVAFVILQLLAELVNRLVAG
jgi:YggT family protein